MRHEFSLMSLLLLASSLQAREANEQYRQILTAIAYHDITIGEPREPALCDKGGFVPWFLGMNACTRRNLGDPFHPDTELMLITSVQDGHILGLVYQVHTSTPAAVAAVEAIKARIETILHVDFPLDGKDIDVNGLMIHWNSMKGQDPGREFAVYDYKLHDELRAADLPKK